MKRVVLIGCGSVLVIALIVAAVAVTIGPKIYRKGAALVQKAVAENTRLQELESQFTPPGDSLEAAWIPPQIGEWRATTPQVLVSSLPRLDIERAGAGGVYERSGQRMEVNIIPANSLEKEALLTHVSNALSKGGGTRMTTSTGARQNTTINGNDKTCLWWIKDWLLIFHSEGEVSPSNFAESYVAAFGSAPAAAKTPAPAASEQPAASQ